MTKGSVVWGLAGIATGLLYAIGQERADARAAKASAPCSCEALTPREMAEAYCAKEARKADECYGTAGDATPAGGDCVSEVMRMLPSEVLAMSRRLDEACEDYLGCSVACPSACAGN